LLGDQDIFLLLTTYVLQKYTQENSLLRFNDNSQSCYIIDGEYIATFP